MITVRRLIRCLAPIGLAGSLVTCSSPTDPGACHNGRDGLGRGPITVHTFSCAYAGSDTIQCTSQQRQTGYCRDSTPRDMTAMTEWLTSNPGAATFISPGLLKVTGTGHVQVIARVGFSEASGDYAYAVAPGATPERLMKLSVILQDATNTQKRLADAAIEVVPERGPPQSCRSSSTGHCQFWVLDGRIRVRATLQGYEPAEGFAVKPFPNDIFQRAIFDLKPIR